VDEFQDIARGRAELIRGLRSQIDDCKLFCVGDDWQSIYRFTGSDLSLMTRFADHFGPTRQTALETVVEGSPFSRRRCVRGRAARQDQGLPTWPLRSRQLLDLDPGELDHRLRRRML
jgi:hypothetical protein